MNRLCVNAATAEFVIIRPYCKRKPKTESIVIDDQPINENQHFRLLGLTLTNTLSFKNISRILLKKLRITLGLLKTPSFRVSTKAIKTVVQSKIIGKIAYGGFSYIVPHIQNVLSMNPHHKVLIKLLYECVRITTRKSRRDKILLKKLCSLCNLRPLNEVIIKQYIIQVWEILHIANHPVKRLLSKAYLSTRLSTLNYFRTYEKNKMAQQTFITPLVATPTDHYPVLRQPTENKQNEKPNDVKLVTKRSFRKV